LAIYPLNYNRVQYSGFVKQTRYTARVSFNMLVYDQP